MLQGFCLGRGGMLKIEVGVKYFDIKTGEQVTIAAVNNPVGFIDYWLPSGSLQREEVESFKTHFLAVDDITEAADILFGDDD